MSETYNELNDGGMDWVQVRLNGGPPCFHLEPSGRRCGRAKRWDGHDSDHQFKSFESVLDDRDRLWCHAIAVLPIEDMNRVLTAFGELRPDKPTDRRQTKHEAGWQHDWRPQGTEPTDGSSK